MRRLKRLAAGLLNLAALSVLLLGSCAGPAVLYAQSPRWFLEEIGSGPVPASFYVAFTSEDSAGSRELHVSRHAVAPGKGHSNIQYRMQEERLSSSAGKGSATIHARNEPQGSQLVQVFVAGNTPWTSLSEYRVADNKIVPLRHAHSAAWLLLGVIVLLALAFPLSKVIRRGINRWLRVEEPSNPKA